MTGAKDGFMSRLGHANDNSERQWFMADYPAERCFPMAVVYLFAGKFASGMLQGYS